MSLPPGDVTAFSPILIPIGNIKMVADEGFEPTDVATFEVAAYASFANLRNHSSLTTRYPPTTPLPFRCLSLVRYDERNLLVGVAGFEPALYGF